MIKRCGNAWLALALFAGILLVLFYPLAQGETLFWGLPTLQFYPWRQLAFEQIAGGHLPTWNPFSGGGAPLLANYQTAIFYPPNWLILLLPDTAAMSAIALLHIVWSGAGMWLWARALGLSDFGRGLSMLAYAFGGYLIARVGSFPTANAGAWVPWLFLCAHYTITRRSAAAAGGLALAFGLQLLAGHAQTAWYSALGAGAYGLWLVLWAERCAPRRQRAIALVLPALAVWVGLAIAAVQLVPTAEYLLESQRSGGLDYDSVTNLSYNPFRLVTLFNPNFYGTPANGSYITEGIFFEDAAYIGFIPITAALATIVARWRLRRELAVFPALRSIPFWAGLALLALLIGMGKHGPVFGWLYNYAPTFDAFREPVRWLILTQFSLAILAGIGVEHWGRSPRIVFWSRLAAAGGGGMALLTLIQPGDTVSAARGRWRALVLIVVALDLAWAAQGLNPTVPAEFFDPIPQERPAGRLYWFDEAEQEVKFEQHFDVADYRPATEHWRAVRASLLPNINMLDDIPSFTNDDPFQPRYHQQYVDLIEDLGADAGALLRAAGVTRIMGTPPVTPLDETGALAWLVGEARWYADDDALIAALRDPAWDPARTVLLAGEPDTDWPASTPVTGSVTLEQDDPAARRYRVSTDGPALLMISTSWYPGWKVEVNSAPAQLYRANLAFMAVPVPAGDSVITLRYHLTGWPFSAFITALGTLAALGLIVLEMRQRYATRGSP